MLVPLCISSKYYLCILYVFLWVLEEQYMAAKSVTCIYTVHYIAFFLYRLMVEELKEMDILPK